LGQTERAGADPVKKRRGEKTGGWQERERGGRYKSKKKNRSMTEREGTVNRTQ